MLTAADFHYWAPLADITDWLSAQIPAGAKVLEVGPGHVPFSRADTFVDFNPVNGLDAHKVDMACEPLPFADKSFDFIYCRHVLEDMYNPFHLCAEMSRVGKAGYIETPSPVAELSRHVDGGSPSWRGYNHHRYVVWAKNGVLNFVAKFPVVEYLDMPEDDANMAAMLRAGPRYWNTYYPWHGSLKVTHLQCPLNFAMPQQYPALLGQAINESVVDTDTFVAGMKREAA